MPDARLPFQLHRLTLRACADLDLHVMVFCPRCRYTTLLAAQRLADTPMAAQPLGRLLVDEVLRCRTERNGRSCDGQPAAAIDVSYIDVGHLRKLATWTVTETGARLSEPPAPD